MSDTIITSLTGKCIWRRRPVWFWQVAGYVAAGWKRDGGLLRPVMVKRFDLPLGL